MLRIACQFGFMVFFLTNCQTASPKRLSDDCYLACRSHCRFDNGIDAMGPDYCICKDGFTIYNPCDNVPGHMRIEMP